MCCAMPPLQCRRPSPPSASHNQAMRPPLFTRRDIRYSDIPFLQKRGANYAVCTISWQASFDWHAENCLRTLMLDVLKATGALDDSIHLSDLDYREAIDALIAGEIDVAMVATQIDDSLLQRALGAPGIKLMNVAQAEAIAKTVPGLKHVVLWRGLISLDRDIPDSDIDLLALRNRLLVRKDLHPALQYLLLEAMREVLGTGPLIVSVNSLPNNPMICPSLQRHKRFTDRARPSGSSTRPSGLPRFSTESCSSSFRSLRCLFQSLASRLAFTDGCTFVVSTNCTGLWEPRT